MHQQAHHLAHPVYRPDVDGLRAVAVTSVIAFHANPSWIQGGFIGVDIFFVISGFLISSIVFSNLERGTFSIAEFYDRRVRRIFPALILVMLTSIAFGWFFLLADEYRHLGKHIAGGAAFVANFFYWSESGYFDRAAETKPMLHLWSLAIEEQFYVFWPLMLAFVWKRHWSFLRITAAIAFLSFSANAYLVSRNPTADFYSPVSRFWELMVGGCLAYLALRHPKLAQSHPNTKSIAGFGMLVCGFAFIDRSRDFPGWWALLPTWGTFLIIWAGPLAWLNRNVLSSRLLVWIGLISYPMYLWHWPLLSFARVVYGANPSVELLIPLLGTCVLLAWGTYKLVEGPVRTMPHSRVSLMLFSIMVVVLGFGASLYLRNGFPQRPVNAPFDYMETMELVRGASRPSTSCAINNGLASLPEEVCLSNSKRPEVLIVGDSHAMALYSAIFAKEDLTPAMLIAGHSCGLYPNLHYLPSNKQSWANNCTAIAKKALAVAGQLETIKTVIIAYAYPVGDLDTDSIFDLDGRALTKKEAFLSGNSHLIDEMAKQGKSAVFVVDNPELHLDPRYCVGRWPFKNDLPCAPTEQEHRKRQENYLGAVAELRAANPGLKAFDTADFLCKGGNCRFSEDGKYLYYDEHHLTIHASQRLLSLMRDGGYF